MILAGASTGDRAETLSGLVKTFAIGGPLALLLASALGWALAALALRPVEAMTERAQRITLARSGERLPLPAADDEIGRLGRTLNDMLARIESSIERERAFVADAGHELRTPLAILRSELELGLRPDRDHEEARAAMRSAIDEASRLEMLADDLLTLARSDAARLQIERRPVTVAGLLADTRARFAGRGEAVGRTIDVEAPPALVWNLDRDRIEAALGNLVENALRHGDGTITLSGRAAGEMLELSVADEGRGFPPGSISARSSASAVPRRAGQCPAPASGSRSSRRSWRPTAALPPPRTSAPTAQSWPCACHLERPSKREVDRGS